MHKLFAIAFLFLSMATFAQKKEIIYLWPGKVPGEVKEKQAPVIDTTRKDGVLRFREITDPALEIWPAEPSISKKTGRELCRMHREQYG